MKAKDPSLSYPVPVEEVKVKRGWPERFPASSSFDEGAGVPAGAVLYLINTPLGVISESGGRITFPLGGDASNWIHTNHTSLDAISTEIGSP